MTQIATEGMLTRLADYAVDHDKRILELEQENRVLNRTLTGLRNYIKIAAEYQNDDLDKRLDGIQAALAEAAKYEPRQMKGRRERRANGSKRED